MQEKKNTSSIQVKREEPAEFPWLKAEFDADGLVTLIDPTDDGSGNIWQVRAHPRQIQYVAERMGLLSASTADTMRTACGQHAELQRLIPWLQMIATRAEQLHDNIMGVSQLGHEDVNIEIAQSAALADLAEQLVKDAQSVVSRHVTQSHDGASVTDRDCFRLAVGVPPGKSPETHAVDAFRAFVQQNAPLLKLVASWGDGECGELLRILQEELQSHRVAVAERMVKAQQGTPKSADLFEPGAK
jgi:hypothetical protein